MALNFSNFLCAPKVPFPIPLVHIPKQSTEIFNCFWPRDRSVGRGRQVRSLPRKLFPFPSQPREKELCPRDVPRISWGSQTWHCIMRFGCDWDTDPNRVMRKAHEMSKTQTMQNSFLPHFSSPTQEPPPSPF